MVKCGVVLAAMVCGVLVYGSRRAFAVEGVVNASYGVVGKCILMFRNAWPKTLLVLQVLKEQGLILAALLGFSAFFLNGRDFDYRAMALEVYPLITE
ncbi:hypothetical protein RchiOBHm_Chr5g0043141 [Rosa chinensis]|uniref:Uncharacterized protein n=1 Tax=Rosa chinensis TaxID=74649 RepID=A0A2P6QD92_ROSCH|nr:hypothetical protein RchiOBHm_Chr5g0043141 [Rosa chinensis]